MPKLNTSHKPTIKYGRTVSTSVSNEDLMTALKSFKTDILATNKAFSYHQESHYEDLKTGLTNLCAQLKETRTENSIFRSEINALKAKIASLESSCFTMKPQAIVGQVLQETFLRNKCQFNLIAYGVPESTSMIIPQRIADDRQSIVNILASLGDVIPLNSKLIRLGRDRDDNTTRPVKIIFENTESPSSLLSQYKQAKQSGSTFLDGFQLVRDKTVYERKLLRECHVELNHRKKCGEDDLRIIFENGIPKVVFAFSENEDVRHTPSSINPQSN